MEKIFEEIMAKKFFKFDDNYEPTGTRQWRIPSTRNRSTKTPNHRGGDCRTPRVQELHSLHIPPHPTPKPELRISPTCAFPHDLGVQVESERQPVKCPSSKPS